MWGWWGRHRPDEVRVGEDEEMGTPYPADGGLDEGMGSLVIECAWCLAEQGVVPTSGSHGICAWHAQQVLAAARERRARRGQR
jgi:hypothetical protein